MKKPHPIQFRAVHSKNRWRSSDHENMANALGKNRGARALFDHLNKAINYAKEGEPLYVIAWHEDGSECRIVKPDSSTRDGLAYGQIDFEDIQRFEEYGPPSNAELERHFRPHDGLRVRQVAEIEIVDPVAHVKPDDPDSAEAVEVQLQNQVELSRLLTHAERLARLDKANSIPRQLEVSTTVFLRNADVIVEVLNRAAGICEQCHAPAPFLRVKDNTPYLEVHHRQPLSMGGEDTVFNAFALCPNCHRKCHFGTSATHRPYIGTTLDTP